MGAAHVWTAPFGPGAPGAHHQGGTRMGSNPQESVVNKYSQSWDIPNLFIMGSSTHPTMSGFNPTLTIQALAYMTVGRHREPLQEESRIAHLIDENNVHRHCEERTRRSNPQPIRRTGLLRFARNDAVVEVRDVSGGR